ncbi:acylphosphatase [Candidatus Methylobacter oryzae]|uniref:acylphosphatase n=1 Tax=Candidatus Methylobacter oryzae TaxID=2497749 RepID=A0ABY3CG66_9GAMM|nr:acylphosphatase [Candidatus Methylobacter oryzae]TRW98523.1 acylphosphatase [Candidatus Methylobacter oryzae]
MRKVKILVSGRVQGVYFRLFTQNKAKHFSIKGYAKNLPDGRVEIVAEAGNLAIEKFIKWCHKGPITARVDHVEVTELQPEEALTSFEIK